jgi:hypothetical protein
MLKLLKCLGVLFFLGHPVNTYIGLHYSLSNLQPIEKRLMFLPGYGPVIASADWSIIVHCHLLVKHAWVLAFCQHRRNVHVIVGRFVPLVNTMVTHALCLDALIGYLSGCI